MSDDDLIHALGEHIKGVIGDSQGNMPAVRHYLGTWIAAEAGDANLSIIQLQGGTRCRFVPRLSHVSGLTAGKTVKLEASPAVPLHITGILVGNIQIASNALNDFTAPTAPTSLATTGVTTSSVALSWTASTDNIAVTAYDVYVNGVFNLTVTGTTATVSNLAASTTFAFTVRARDASGNVSSVSNSVNGTTSTPSAPGVQTYVVQYAATWSRSFNANGSNEYDSWYGDTCIQGQYSGGNQAAMIGFDTTKIASDLSGATCLGAQIRLTYFHWYYNNGGTAIIGTHAQTSAPSTLSGTQNRWQSGGWGVGATRWVDLGGGTCSEFQSGATRGIIIGKGPSSSVLYYGKAYGASGGVYVPILQLTFSK